jgi:H+/Cl- antiporter ClcA
MTQPKSKLSGLGGLGDFTASPRMLLIVGLAVLIGLLGAGLAVVLLRLIAFFTNLFFYQRLGIGPASPSDHTLGPWVIAVPVIGATLVGLMARYGSERIRGHGIPEAIEAILMRGSRTEPKLVLLKPLSAAISIGSGGPFGAEGPIIMTAGSFGSMIAQMIHLTDTERKTLLVSGAAAGMSATFASPLAAILLAVELLLFEWKPRSFVPVAAASVTAFLARRALLGPGPLFPVPPHPASLGLDVAGACLLAGFAAGLLSAVLTTMVYWSEDAFAKLPIHWMWWPPIGGVVVGLGGWLFPTALGVGYQTISGLLQGRETVAVLGGILIVKSVIWAVSLGSGTSGGVLAPLLMMGGALGGLEAAVFPREGAGFWALVSMAAVLGGTMRAPFTAVVFGLELTHDLDALVPMLLAVVVAHAFTVLTLPRSILTEKVSRRGYHLSREYTVDPLEILLVRDVMGLGARSLTVPATLGAVTRALDKAHRSQRLFPLVDDAGALVGVRSRTELERLCRDPSGLGCLAVAEPTPVVTISPRMPLRVAVYRMAETGFTRLPVVAHDGATVLGILTLEDLLKARVANLEAENHRRRHLGLWSLVTAFSAREEAPEG